MVRTGREQGRSYHAVTGRRHRRCGARLAAFVAAVAGAVGGDGPAAAAPPSLHPACLGTALEECQGPQRPRAAFTYDGTGCHESVVLATVPMSEAEKVVPAGYTPTNIAGAPAGHASVGIATLRCDQMRLDGVALDKPVISDVGVAIAAPDDTPGAHWYALWQVQGSEPLADRMRKVGVGGGFVPAISASERLAHGTGDVPWAVSAYHLEVDAPVPAQPETPDTGTTWWHHGKHGQVRIGYFFPRSSAEVGVGTASRLTGPLAQLLGGETAQALGLLVHLDFQAEVTADAPATRPHSTPPPPGRAQPAIRLTVRPEHGRTSRRFRLRLRATAAGRPVAGAAIRLAGRRTRTDSRGRATLTVRLRRPGRHTAIATADGLRPGRASIRVKRGKATS